MFVFSVFFRRKQLSAYGDNPRHYLTVRLMSLTVRQSAIGEYPTIGKRYYTCIKMVGLSIRLHGLVHNTEVELLQILHGEIFMKTHLTYVRTYVKCVVPAE